MEPLPCCRATRPPLIAGQHPVRACRPSSRGRLHLGRMPGSWISRVTCSQPPLAHIAPRVARVVEKCCGAILPGPCGAFAEAITNCDGIWGSLFLPIALAFSALFMASVLTRTCRELRRILFSEKGSSAAAKANRVLAALRQADPQAFPPFPHNWQRLVIHHGWTQVLYCCACHADIGSRTFSHAANFCALCGAVAHTACLKHVGETCRPLSLDGHTHWWQAPNSVIHLEDEEGSVSASQACHLCQEGCATVPVTPEPSWQCALCFAAVHVSCWCEAYGQRYPSVQDAFASLDGSRTPSKEARKPLLVASQRRELEAILGSMRKRRRDRIAGRDTKSLDECVPLLEAALPPWEFVWAPGLRDAASPEPGEEGMGTASAAPHQDMGHGTGAQRKKAWWRRRRAGVAEAESIPELRPKLGVVSSSNSMLLLSRLRGSQTEPQDPRDLVTATVKYQRAKPLVDRGSSQIRHRRPVLVFVNTKSGAREGAALQLRLQRILHPMQIVELPKEDPAVALEQFGAVPGLRILVVGGDGTVSWVLSALEERKNNKNYYCDGDKDKRPDDDGYPSTNGSTGGEDDPNPPVGIVPLGTGNDLARVLGWGASADAWMQLPCEELLQEVEHAAPVFLDRWRVTIVPEGRSSPRIEGRIADDSVHGRSIGTDEATTTTIEESSIHPLPSSTSQKEGMSATNPKVLSMTNYLGIGSDAGVALGFHAMREGYPGLFGSQLGNKLLYTLLGARQMLDSMRSGDLSGIVSLEVDGRPVALPAGTQCLVLLNIGSFMGGVDVWGGGEATEMQQQVAPMGRQRYCDGKLEVVAIFGIWHLGKLHAGLDTALRLAQGSTIRITLRHAVPMQVDGEARNQAPGEILVESCGQVLMLKRVHPELAGVIKAVRSGLEDAVAEGVLNWSRFVSVYGKVSRRVQDQLDFAS